MSWLELSCKIEIILMIIGIGMLPILYMFTQISNKATQLAEKYIEITYKKGN
jgi:hypothetical protein